MKESAKNLLLSKAILKGDNKPKIAKVLGISHQALYKKFSGDTEWSKEDIKKLQKKYNISPEEVYQIFLQ